MAERRNMETVEQVRPAWQDALVGFLATHAPEVEPAPLIEAVRHGTMLLVHPLTSGDRLLLLRLLVRTLDREEVFMGSALFGDWLRKCFPQAVEGSDLGKVHPVTNDLEVGYFLVVTKATVDELAEVLATYVSSHLAELFLGDADLTKGLHGDLRRMLSIPKSDFEPFPIFAVPRFLLREVELRARQELRAMLRKPFIRTRPTGRGKVELGVSLDYRLIQSTMAFFCGRTSGGVGDSQSHNTFLARLVTEYGLISPEELAAAFRLPPEVCPGSASWGPDQQRQAYKEGIEGALKNLSFDEERLRALLTRVLENMAAEVDGSPDGPDDPAPGETYLRSWFMPFIRSNHKAIEMTREDYVRALLHRVTLGPRVLALAALGGGWACRTCGDQRAIVPEKNILLGVSVGKFYNQLPNQPHASIHRICARCALYTYLGTKLFGATTIGKFPVPKQDNLIFHYGQHTEAGVRTLGRDLSMAIDLMTRLEDKRIGDILARQKQKEEGLEEVERAQQEMFEIEGRISEIAAYDPELHSLDPAELDRINHLAALLSDADGQGIGEILRQAAQCQVIDLGAGDDRLMVFALPRMKDDLELADRRFVKARLTVYALIGFLQEACGCQGPYFFRALPRVTEHAGGDDADRFYVEDRSVSGMEYRRRYQAAAAFACRVTKGHGKEALTGWLGLSERLTAAPLETFADVLRDSPLQLGSDLREARYGRLSNREGRVVFDRDLNVWDGWEYLRAYRSLHDLWRAGSIGG
jgi:hypothetical protein